MDWNNVFGKNKGIDEIDRGQYDKLEKTSFISGCCFMVDAKVFDEVGYFNEKLFAYFEDVDFMLRLEKVGYKLFYYGKTQIYHKVSRTSGIASELTDYLITRNRLYVGFTYAPIKTRYSLWKESVRFLISGRNAQKQGVWDFYFSNYGVRKGLVKTNSEEKHIYPKRLSITIVNYKTKKLTLELLESIFRKDSGFNKTKDEVVLVDNGSEDDIRSAVWSKYPKVKYSSFGYNSGFAKGYNKAIHYSLGEYILLLNSDIKVDRGAIKRMLKFSEGKNGQVVVVGKLILPDGTTQMSCYNLPTIWRAFSEYILGHTNDYAQYYPNSPKPTKVEGAVMACFMIPRRVLNKIGMISEKSFLYFEDIEYCRRLNDKGVDIYYLPDAVFFHRHGASSKIIGKDKSYDFLRKGAVFYHGKIRYIIIWTILWVGQKLRNSQKTAP